MVFEGSESRFIGALLSGWLTDAGEAYTLEMVNSPNLTSYQKALYRFWREAFDL